MSDHLFLDKNPTIHLDDDVESKYIERIAYALSSPERIAIMRHLAYSNKSLSALSSELNIPITTVTRHVNALAEAGLIVLNYQPGIKGHAKYCAHAITSFTISLASEKPQSTENKSYSIEMPIGMFAHCHISAPCGLLGPEQLYSVPQTCPSSHMTITLLDAQVTNLRVVKFFPPLACCFYLLKTDQVGLPWWSHG